MSAGVRFTARNGGHQYEANSLLDNGVVVDLVKLQALDVDDASSTVVVGAGQKVVSDSSGGGAATSLMVARCTRCCTTHAWTQR